MVATSLPIALGTRGTQTLNSIAKRSSSSNQNSSGLSSLASRSLQYLLKGWWGSVLRWDFPRFASELDPRTRAHLFETFVGGLFYDGMSGVCHSWDTPRKAYVSLFLALKQF
jgi:hypothetical protein